jgi:hypothetical protein
VATGSGPGAVPDGGQCEPVLRLWGPPNAKSSEVYATYLIVDMYAKAVPGTKPEESLKQAEIELKKVYG